MVQHDAVGSGGCPQALPATVTFALTEAARARYGPRRSVEGV